MKDPCYLEQAKNERAVLLPLKVHAGLPLNGQEFAVIGENSFL